MYVIPSLLDENPINRNARNAFLKNRSCAFLLYLYMVSRTSEKSSSPAFFAHAAPLLIDSSLLCLCDKTTRDSIPVNSARCQSFIWTRIRPKFASAQSFISQVKSGFLRWSIHRRWQGWKVCLQNSAIRRKQVRLQKKSNFLQYLSEEASSDRSYQQDSF